MMERNPIDQAAALMAESNGNSIAPVRLEEDASYPKCGSCKAFERTGCLKKAQVIAKHGQFNLDMWLLRARNRNTCTIYVSR